MLYYSAFSECQINSGGFVLYLFVIQKKVIVEGFGARVNISSRTIPFVKYRFGNRGKHPSANLVIVQAFNLIFLPTIRFLLVDALLLNLGLLLTKPAYSGWTLPIKVHIIFYKARFGTILRIINNNTMRVFIPYKWNLILEHVRQNKTLQVT